MSRWPTLLLLAALTAGLPACTESQQGLQGSWAIDIDKTLARAQKDGASANAVKDIRSTFEGALMDISADTLTLRVDGYPGSQRQSYTAGPAHAGCHDVNWAGHPGIHSYCVRGDELIVRQPGTRLALVYTRR